jgi:hypothetical protein
MSKKCRAFSRSGLGLEPPDNKRAFSAGWDAAVQELRSVTYAWMSVGGAIWRTKGSEDDVPLYTWPPREPK